jgi:uncharacterized damage-inducible protein DinB
MSDALLATRAIAVRHSAADFPGTIRSFYPFWDTQYRPYLVEAVRLLPAEHFDWKPQPGMFSARQIVLHIAEVESYWIDHLAGGAPYTDFVVDREGQVGWFDGIDAPDHAALLGLLEKHHAPTQRLMREPASELSRDVIVPAAGGGKRSITLHWLVDHVQEHEIHHRAQLNLYLRLLGITPPSI